MTDLRKKFGMVALIDALGARTHNISDSIKYIECIQQLKNEIELNFIETRDLIQRKIKEAIIKDIKVKYFGDTVLFSLELKSDEYFTENLATFGHVLNKFISDSIKKSILFRGAFAIGEYIETEDIVLGPAIIDAANWFEKIDLIGISATPQTKYQIESRIYNSHFNTKSGSILLQYNIPIKNNNTVSSLIFNWPFSTIPVDIINKWEKCDESDFNDQINWFYQHFKIFSITELTLHKYNFTEKFFIESLNLIKNNIIQTCLTMRSTRTQPLQPTKHP